LSSFAIAPTTVTFIADLDTFNERTDGGLRVWEFKAYLTLPTDYTSLFSLRSWLVSKKPMPGGTTSAATFVDIAGGAGKGTLTLDNVVGSPFTAALTRIQRPSAYPGGSRYANCTFEETP
jgi:hypothetical protein